MTITLLEDAAHIAIDIETLGVRPGAPVLSIGIAEFNEQGVFVKREYHHDFEDAVHASQHVDGSTIKWWLKMVGDDPSLAGQFDRPHTCGTKLFLKLIANTIEDIREDAPRDEKGEPVIRVWAAPARFDFGLLLNLFETQGMAAPWQHWEERDGRTVYDLAPHLRVKPETKHLAVDDAVALAESMIKIHHHLIKATKHG